MAFDFSDVDIERMKSALQNDRIKLSRLTAYTHTILCLAGTACGIGVSLSSITFILVLLITRWVAPGTIQFTQPLYFDYSKPVVTGHIDLGTQNTPLLTPGQHVDVWLELLLPPEDPFTATFQVSAAMHAATSATARMSRAYRYQPPAPKLQDRLPWPLSRRRVLPLSFHVPLFDDYVELPDAPSRAVEVAMMGRSGSDRVPEVVEARMHLRLRLGLLRSLLHKVRPGTLWTAVLLLSALATASAGALLAISALLLLTLSMRIPRAANSGAPAATDAPASSVPEATAGSASSGNDLDSAASAGSYEGLLQEEADPFADAQEQEGPSMRDKEAPVGPGTPQGARRHPDPEDEEYGSEEALLQHVAGWQASPSAVQREGGEAVGHSSGSLLARGGSGLRRRESRHPSTEDTHS